MAIGDYILCCKCEVKLIYDGNRDQREWWEERFGKEPEIECPNCKPQRTWVGLTEQEHTDIAVECGCMSADWVFYGAAVERKIKEKNTI